jgi:CheY-like chemotaxis protein
MEAVSSDAKTILLVENDPDIRDVLLDILARRGYRMLSAEHGRDALQLLRSGVERPCLILLDLTMPVMSGWEFMEEQATDPALAEIPVVVMSAVANLEGHPGDRPWAALLTKPVTLQRLLDTVSLHCG